MIAPFTKLDKNKGMNMIDRKTEQINNIVVTSNKVFILEELDQYFDIPEDQLNWWQRFQRKIFLCKILHRLHNKKCSLKANLIERRLTIEEVQEVLANSEITNQNE